MFCTLCSLWMGCANPQWVLQDPPVPPLSLSCLRQFLLFLQFYEENRLQEYEYLYHTEQEQWVSQAHSSGIYSVGKTGHEQNVLHIASQVGRDP